MTKLNRYLLIALVIQLVILVMTQLTSRGPSTTKPRKLFDKLDVQKVTGLRVAEEKKLVQLEQKDGKWVLASGGDYPAKKDKVTEFLAKLPGLTVTTAVTTRKEHFRKLEVADDKYQRKVTVTLEGGKPETFYLGSSPGIKNVHLRMAGQDSVYLVSDLTAWEASATASDWVDAEYFKVDRDRVVGLTLKNAGGELKLTKQGGSWSLEGMEAGATLKQTEVDSLLSSGSSVNLQEPVGRTIQPKQELGDKAQATLTLLVEQKPDPKAKQEEAQPPPAQVTHTLVVGAKDGDSYYVKSSGSEFVVKVASWAVESLVNKKAADLWEKKKEGKEETSPPPMPGGMPPGMPGGMPPGMPPGMP